MAGPAFNSVGSRSTSAGATSRAPSKPSSAAAPGLMLAVVTTKNNETHACADGDWTKIAQVNSGASFTASLWRARGNAAAPTFTWTSSVACSAHITYYDDPANAVDNAIGASTSNTGSTSTHSTSSVNTTRDNSLMVYVDAAAANTALATPSGWAEDSDTGSGTDAGRTVFGSKAVASSGGASGAISVTGGNADWVQWQVEIMGELPDADTAAFSKVEVGAWEEPPDGANFSKVEVGAWLDVLVASGRRRQAMVVN